VEIEFTPAEELKFRDTTFTHSITNCVIARLKDDGAAQVCKEIHRTLKPGGVAVVSIWAHAPHWPAMAAAHDATSPAGSPPLLSGTAKWEDGTLALTAAGSSPSESERMHPCYKPDQGGCVEAGRTERRHRR
jgi:SAM-dependent methyltransferase